MWFTNIWGAAGGLVLLGCIKGEISWHISGRSRMSLGGLVAILAPAWRGVWRLVALATTGGNIRRFSQDKHKTRPRAHAHTGQPGHTGRAHAHLCVVALLGGGWLSCDPGGRRESELPPTFVSVRSVVTDLSTCVAYVSAHLKHTCVKSYHNGTFL